MDCENPEKAEAEISSMLPRKRDLTYENGNTRFQVRSQRIFSLA